jgi:hypothetical protein
MRWELMTASKQVAISYSTFYAHTFLKIFKADLYLAPKLLQELEFKLHRQVV